VGVYEDAVHESAKVTKPAEMLMGFGLDGQGARRKTVRASVPVEWSFDNQWVLVQDGSSACITRATGGEYKCWRGYTAVSLAPDGSYALLLGNRDQPPEPTKSESKSKSKSKSKKSKSKSKSKKSKSRSSARSSPSPVFAFPDDSPDGSPVDPFDEPADEPEQRGTSEDMPIDDVAVPPPSGPLALYRAKLGGAFTETPALVVRVVDGAAVWIPTRSP